MRGAQQAPIPCAHHQTGHPEYVDSAVLHSLTSLLLGVFGIRIHDCHCADYLTYTLVWFG